MRCTALVQICCSITLQNYNVQLYNFLAKLFGLKLPVVIWKVVTYSSV